MVCHIGRVEQLLWTVPFKFIIGITVRIVGQPLG